MHVHHQYAQNKTIEIIQKKPCKWKQKKPY